MYAYRVYHADGVSTIVANSSYEAEIIAEASFDNVRFVEHVPPPTDDN